MIWHANSMRAFDDALPIDAVLDDITRALKQRRRAVLVAPPGAGKTTRVPLVLLDLFSAEAGKILLLEPRRVAAVAASERMARTLGEPVGETIGIRTRGLTMVSARTRIEVVTEGVFTRMIVADPELCGVAAVLFDEFHERSLDADLGLALALDVSAGLRDDLGLLVMSATLDDARVAQILGDVPVIRAEGRAFPVETRYLGRDPRARIEMLVETAVLRALAEESGSILVFLPGQAEIRRIAAALETRLAGRDIEIAPFHSGLDRKAQNRAMAPIDPLRRKIVLATSIAETSLTIEGVRIVIDCGLARVPHFEPGLGLTRLDTVKVSRAGADQRRGRAGRTAPGVCYRLWDEAATGALEPFAAPEILAADLSGLVLDLTRFGVRDPKHLAWIDPPPEPALGEARTLLGSLAALDADLALTDEGRAMAQLALPPRLAKMLLGCAREGSAATAAEIATLLVERGLGGSSPDLARRLDSFRRDDSPRGKDARRLARSLAASACRAIGVPTEAARSGPRDLELCGSILATAFPDRIAKARGKPGEFLMANGRAAALEPSEQLACERFLAIGEIAGKAASSRILVAAALLESEIDRVAGPALESKDEIFFDAEKMVLRACRRRRLGAIVLAEHYLPVAPGPEPARVLAHAIAKRGLDLLPWTKPLRQWRDRVAFVAMSDPGAAWPDLSDRALADHVEDWLAPSLEDKTSLAELAADQFEATLKTLLSHDLRRRLDLEAPAFFETPAGSKIAIHYDTEQGPVVSVRVQELFGLASHPELGPNRHPVTFELLSPASRPIQITRDLPGFWLGSWSSVKAEMRGRYPRHVWPDDPANAIATTRAKPRGKPG
jgi:ATP-dependent helicase HrpB